MFLYNAKIHTMSNKGIIENGFVEVVGGKIGQVFEGKISPCDGDFDCNGFDLYPGFIDSHTHLGMIEDGLGFEGDDSNEGT
ncbi:MAG: amidohydrolase, partial [Oscillospiraceae bacterium]